MIYLSLFLSAFIAATLFPFGSEALLLTYQSAGHSVLALWLVASAGNVLGSCVNWWLGSELLRFQHRQWFPFKPKQIDSAQLYFQRYGVWSLLFAWLPIIGDPLTLVAGIMRVRFWVFVVLVVIGKAGRYGALLWAFL